MGYSEDEIFAALNESEQARKRRQKLAKVTEAVAAYRLREMKDLQAREKLATWRRMNGFDRVADGEDNWFHCSRSLPPTPEEFVASLWSEVNALKAAISMPVRGGSSWQELKRNLIRKIELDEVSDEDFTIVKHIVERRGRDAAQVTVTPVDTVRYCSPRPQTPEPSSDIRVCMKKNNERRMDPERDDSERDELESPSAGTGLETPGQQCPPNEGTWEKGRTIADGYLLVGMGSNQGGDISSPTEHVGTRVGTAATPTKPRDKITSEENKYFDSGGKGEKAPLWNAAVALSFFFLGGA